MVTLVSSSSFTGPGGATSPAINTTGASLLFVSLSWYPGFDPAPVVTDSKSNTWTALTLRNGIQAAHRFYYVISPTVGASHTVAVSGTNIYCSGTFAAFGGVATFYVENGATATSGTSLATGSVTPAVNGSLIVSGWTGFNATSNPTVDSSLSPIKIQNPVASVCVAGATSYLVQTTAAVISPTWSWTGSDYAANAIAVFSPTASATSYSNPGGSGDRTTSIIVTSVGGGGGPTSSSHYLVNGSTVDTNFFFTSTTGCSIEFWFPSRKIIDEVTVVQQTAATHGTWKWQGGNDRTTWTDIGSTFTLGGATTQVLTTLAGNTTGYLFYRLLQVSGTASGSPYIFEYTFKIEDAGGASYLHSYGSGNRTSLITITSSGIVWTGGTANLINGDQANTAWWDTVANVAGHWIQFDFGSTYIVQEARIWISGPVVTNHGSWKFQGSLNGTTWTDLSGTITIGPGTYVGITNSYVTHVNGFISNTTAYRYYRYLGVSGGRNNTPYEQEFDFMVGAAVAASAETSYVCIDDLLVR